MVKSLVELCSNVAIKNVREIHDLGTIPYHLARPILMRIDSGAHLRELEERSSHFADDDAECWIRLIKKNFPQLLAKHNYQPKNPTRWYRIYERYQEEDAEIKARAEEALKSAFAGIKKEKEDNLSQVINYSRALPKPPADIRGPSGARRGPGRVNDLSELRFTGGSRTKTTSGQGVLRRARREAQEIARRNRLNTPTGSLVAWKGQIKQAPQGMKDEHRVKNQPVAQKIRVPGGSKSTSNTERQMKQREDRLRALKKGPESNQGATMISDSESGDEYERDDEPSYLDDLFDYEEQQSPPPKPISSAPKASPAPPKKTSGGILSNRYSGTPMTRVSSTASPSTSTSRHSVPQDKQKAPAKTAAPAPRANSPPARQIPTASAGSPDMVPRKRKQADVFMKPKKSRQA